MQLCYRLKINDNCYLLFHQHQTLKFSTVNGFKLFATATLQCVSKKQKKQANIKFKLTKDNTKHKPMCMHLKHSTTKGIDLMTLPLGA